MTALKAVRVRKARRPGTCAVCHGPVKPGQQIASVNRAPWAHVMCTIAAARLTAEPRPAGEGSQ